MKTITKLDTYGKAPECDVPFKFNVFFPSLQAVRLHCVDQSLLTLLSGHETITKVHLVVDSWLKHEIILSTLHSLPNLQELILNVKQIGQDRKEIACIQQYVLSSSLHHLSLRIPFRTNELHPFLDELPHSIQSLNLTVEIAEGETVSHAWWEKHFQLERSKIKLCVSLRGDLEMKFDLGIPVVSQHYIVYEDCVIADGEISPVTLQFAMSGCHNHCVQLENSNLQKILNWSEFIVSRIVFSS